MVLRGRTTLDFQCEAVRQMYKGDLCTVDFMDEAPTLEGRMVLRCMEEVHPFSTCQDAHPRIRTTKGEDLPKGLLWEGELDVLQWVGET